SKRRPHLRESGFLPEDADLLVKGADRLRVGDVELKSRAPVSPYLTSRRRREAITTKRRRRCCTCLAMRSLVEQNPSCACPLASTVAQPSVANSRFRKQASSSRRSEKIGSGMNFSQAASPQRPSDSSQRVSRLRSLF